MKLLSKSALAAEMGRAPTYVSAMCRAGYSMKYGTRTTFRHALSWLAENPGFRVTDVYSSELRRTGRGLQVSTADR